MMAAVLVPPEPPRVLETWGEIARYIGRSERTARRAGNRRLHSDPLPWFSFLGRVRAKPEDLDAWMARHGRR